MYLAQPGNPRIHRSTATVVFDGHLTEEKVDIIANIEGGHELGL